MKDCCCQEHRVLPPAGAVPTAVVVAAAAAAVLTAYCCCCRLLVAPQSPQYPESIWAWHSNKKVPGAAAQRAQTRKKADTEHMDNSISTAAWLHNSYFKSIHSMPCCGTATTPGAQLPCMCEQRTWCGLCLCCCRQCSALTFCATGLRVLLLLQPAAGLQSAVVLLVPRTRPAARQ